MARPFRVTVGVLLPTVLSVLSVLWPATAPAQQPAPLAQSLFEEARTLMEKGDYERACGLLAESERIDPGGGTQLNLALCHEKQGRIATAWAEYNEALSAAIRDGRKDRKDFASERIAALRPHLPYLIVVAPPLPAPGLALQVDGADLPRATWGVAFPVDPGPHDIRATAPGRRPFSTHLASVAQGLTAEVRVPELELPASGPTAEGRGAGTTRLAPVSLVSGAVAIVAVGTSAVTGLMALSAQNSARDKCSATRDFCPDPSGRDDASRAVTLAWVSTVTLVVGAAAAATAIIWPRARADAPDQHARIAPVLYRDGGGLVAAGTF
jgi:hypothetical protein